LLVTGCHAEGRPQPSVTMLGSFRFAARHLVRLDMAGNPDRLLIRFAEWSSGSIRYDGAGGPVDVNRPGRL
jgi:hypothetical protein